MRPGHSLIAWIKECLICVIMECFALQMMQSIDECANLLADVVGETCDKGQDFDARQYVSYSA